MSFVEKPATCVTAKTPFALACDVLNIQKPLQISHFHPTKNHLSFLSIDG
jgi:hypothetical protein